MKLEICIGSACHIRGSYDVIEQLKELIAKHELDCEIGMKACFCMGNCGEGVSVRLNEADIIRIMPETTAEFFRNNILEKRHESD